MEKQKPSSNLQVAVSCLATLIVGAGWSVAVALAQIPGYASKMAVSLAGADLFLAVLFLPLLWWRHKAGYAGSIGVAIYT